jgi:membrane protease YdiL (CAAX protease family)
MKDKNSDNQKLQVLKSRDAKKVILKILHFPLTRIIIGGIVCILVPYITKSYLIKPGLGLLSLGEDITKPIQWILLIVLIFSTYYFLFKYYEKREITELSRKYFIKESFLGFFAGVISISFVIFILYASRIYTVLSINTAPLLLKPLIFLTLMALTEELLFRGILYRITEESLGTNFALIISALFFGFSHITNEHASIISVIAAGIGGLWVGIIFTLTRRLWVPIFLHLGWNFAQIFYGTTVSGMDEFSPNSFFRSKLEGPEILTGGAFGPENSIITIMFTLMLFAVIYYLTLKKSKVINPCWKRK